MSTTAPIWLLDIDGVLNALHDPESGPHAHWSDLEVRDVGTSQGNTYRLAMGRPVIDFVNAQFSSGTDIRWATTWQHDANRFVAPAFGLPIMPVGAEALGMSDYYYKERAALAAIKEGRPLIWTDDDAIGWHARGQIEESGIPHLLIEPTHTIGLTPEHLGLIEVFVNKYR